MRTKLVTIGILVLGLLVIACYSESLVIMKGDYLFTKWIGITETNKSWFLILFLMLVGGSLTYILVRGTKLLRKRKGEK